MTLLLSSKNVGEYLVNLGICTQSEQHTLKIEPLAAKNFNLLVSSLDGRKLLVKQERHNQEGKTAGEFLQEWKIQEFLQQFPELKHLSSFLPSVLNFDREHSILVFSYLDNYRDLVDFYGKENIFPPEIAFAIGTNLASIHRATFNNQDYQQFLNESIDNKQANMVPSFIHSLERITPEIFGLVPTDGLKFFALYQRYDSLGQAIAELGNAFIPCCVTHNDLKLNNILLSKDWEHSQAHIVRLIDWERSGWGDPAFDLGMLIASYLQMWLGSLVISQALTIEDSLRLANSPLDAIQPAIAALSIAYLENFPEILQHRPDFWRRVVQFSGLALIQQIQAMIQYQKSFGNAGICMLQVAKSLLCRPEQSMTTVFGTAATVLNQANFSVA
ncbi:phosphotransferase [Nostoc sp. PA-18-2419]|uniref:phosphotransferase n=1 Tax=Nostoc sp. PA-18-2419 TaxID=2575443 RepID=UPI0011090E37|nr:phosphotransferase [Nostoc sp. PA-18-2419]